MVAEAVEADRELDLILAKEVGRADANFLGWPTGLAVQRVIHKR